MEKRTKTGITQGILSFLLVSAFVFFIVSEVLAASENISEVGNCRTFDADWVQIKPDGTREIITIPGTCEAEKGEWVTITTELSKSQKSTWLCFRSMQQEMNIYIDDELRESFSTLETQMFGKTSTISYVFCKLNDSDAGKTLRVDMMSESSYSGFVNEILEGEKFDITIALFELYAPSTIIAIFMFVLSILVIAASLFVKIVYKKKVELAYLGAGILVTATWMIVESRLRQFMFSNSSMAVTMGFLMIAILPYPFLSYINSIQRHRYHREYMALNVCVIVNYLAVLTLQVLGIKDFYETMLSSHIMMVVGIILVGSTIIRDIIRKCAKDYSEVIGGIILFILTGVCELGLVYVADAKFNGIAVCVGLMMLLFSAGLKAIRDLFNMEKEKQIAIAASESKAKFLANMSHEIRTPINTVIGMNEMILRENKDKTIEEYANNVKSASQMLLSLVNDVLDFSKIEAGKLEIVENDYRPAVMLNDVIKSIELRASQKKLEIKSCIDETIPAVLKGDEVRIKQILNNLLSNAVKYTEKGSITITAKSIHEEKDFYLFLAVEDTGMGIKKEDVERLFDSFQRLELKKNRYIEGTGLGLNITKQLVENMGGTIAVKSEYGVGSCFSVKIPQQIVKFELAEEAEQENKSSSAESNDSPKKELYAPDAKILAVDDTPMNLKIIKGLLKKTQIQIDFAGGGNECLQLTKEKKYDLILMDAMMPEPDGVQTLHLIREDKDNLNKNTEVIVLTADAIEGVKEKYINEGFSDYIPKPVDPEMLEATIARFLQ